MSKWSLVESKERKFLTSLPIFLILLAGFVTIIILPRPANAVAPSFNMTDNEQNSSGGNSFKFSDASGTLHINPASIVGDVILITTTSIAPNFAISSVTDTLGDTWFTAQFQNTIIPNPPLTYLCNYPLPTQCPITSYSATTLSNYYTVVANTAATTMNITVNWGGTTGAWTAQFYTSNVPLSLVGATTSSVFQSTTAVVGTPPNLAAVLSSNFNFKSNAQYAIIGLALGDNKPASQTFSIVTQSPMSNIQTVLCSSTGATFVNTCELQTGTIITNSSAFLQFFANQYAATPGINFVYSMAYLYDVFSTVTVAPPNCQICGLAGGGTTKDTSTTFQFIGNNTYFYPVDAPVGGALVANVTTEIASYTNAGVGKSKDFIYMCIYQLKPGVLQSANPIGATNPLNQNQCILINSVATGATNVFLHWYPNIAIPASTTFAIAIFSRFAGLKLYGTTDNIITNLDTADYVDAVNHGTPPGSLTVFTQTQAEAIWFNFQGSQANGQTGTNTVTATTTLTVCAAGATCTNTVATVTNYLTTTQLIYRLQGSNGAVANIQDLTTFLPIWVLPLVMGALFGVVGLLFGGVVGVGMGVMLGIIPLWFAFLLGLGIVFLLFKRVI